MPPLLTTLSCDSPESEGRRTLQERTTENLDLQTPKAKHVSFSEKVMVINHINRFDLGEQERRSCWYEKSELHKIRKENDVTVNRMMTGAALGADECPRGLENRTSLGSRMRQKYRQEAVGSVLHFQMLQMEAGDCHNAKALARVYGDHTQRSTQLARTMANIVRQSILEAENSPSRSHFCHPPCSQIKRPDPPASCLRERGCCSPPIFSIAA